jgi:undecaprenyl pyrophosphate phosphatase UppP
LVRDLEREGLKDLLFLAVAFAALLFPWLLQVALTPKGCVPNGHLMGYEDYVTFIAKMEWGRLGHWSYIDRYTPEITEPAPIYFFYLSLGHLAKLSGLSTLWVFHLARSLLGSLAAWGWWRFCRKRSKYPLPAFLLGIWASFGLFALFGPDMRIYETYVQGHAANFGMIGFPHYLVDFLAILAFLEAYLDGGKKAPVLSLLVGAGLGMVHPFLLALFPTVIIAHAALFDKDRLRDAFLVAACAALGSLPFIISMWAAYQKFEWLRIWRSQTAHETGLLGDGFRLAVTFGLGGAVAWFRIPGVVRSGEALERLSAVWLVLAGVLLVFAPIPNSREFGFFLTIPVAMLAAPWLVEFSRRVNTLKVNLMLPALVIACCACGFLMFAEMYRVTPDSYHPQGLVEGLRWLEENSGENDAAACTWATGSVLPMYVTHPRPWVGHQSETLGFLEKEKQVLPFFRGEIKLPVQWAVVGKGVDRDIPRLPGEPVYENDSVVIWRVD